jgi:YD repeat-containing protein
VGETGHGTDTQTNTVKLDTDAYSLVINRVTSGTWTDPSTGTAHSDSCTYDNNGNVLTFTTDASGTAKTTTNTLDEQNHNLTTDTGDQQTTRTYDLSGRMTRMVMNQGGKTYTYDYTYIRRRP